MNFKEFEEISSAVKKINTHKYYDIKFDFSKITYKKSNSIDLEEGISVLCPLECIQKSFACGTEKGKIKIYIKNSEDNEYTESGNWSMDDSPRTESITNLIELKKNENNENILLSGSSDKKLRLFLIKKNDNKCKIECKSEFPNDGLILDIFQLSDGRIAYSTSNEKIKIWNLNEKYNNNEMEISNKYVGFEKCLSEIQIFENDENNKQLVSGGREGYLKRWDINSGKMPRNLDEARAVVWPYDKWTQRPGWTIGQLLDNHEIGQQNFSYALYQHWNDQVYQASAIILSDLLNIERKKIISGNGLLLVEQKRISFMSKEGEAATYKYGFWMGILGIVLGVIYIILGTYIKDPLILGSLIGIWLLVTGVLNLLDNGY